VNGSLSILQLIIILVSLVVALVPLWRTMAAIRRGDFSCSHNLAKEWYLQLAAIAGPLVIAFFLFRSGMETLCDIRHYVHGGVRVMGTVQNSREVKDCGSAPQNGVSISTSGKISYRDKSEHTHYDLSATYPLPDGQMGRVEFTRGDSYAPGEQVAVYYRPEAPQDALVYDATNSPCAAAMYLTMGGAMVSLSLTFGLLALMQRRKRRCKR